MTAKDYLQQYQFLKVEYNSALNVYQALANDFAATGLKSERVTKILNDAEKKTADNLKKCLEQLNDIENTLNGLEKPLHRAALRLIYIDGMSVQEAAETLGYSNRSSISHILPDALKAVEAAKAFNI